MSGPRPRRHTRSRLDLRSGAPVRHAVPLVALLALALLVGFPGATGFAATRSFVAPAGASRQPLALATSGLRAGDATTVRGDHVRLRATPSDFGEVVAILRRGDAITLTGAAEDAGSVWWPVEVVASGERGWLKWIAVAGGSPIAGASATAPDPAPGPDRETVAAPGAPEASPPQGRGFKGVVARAFVELDAYWVEQDDAAAWRYRSPAIRRFGAPKNTRCGPIAPGAGPAYCPFDEAIYVDMDFLDQTELAADPFLVKVIMAHEWAHHIQQLAGFAKTLFPDEPGEVFGVQLELHADCLAGVWVSAAEASGEATRNDVLRAAALAFVLGDTPDTLLVDPSAHGTGDLRLGAFALGYDGGDVDACAGLLEP